MWSRFRPHADADAATDAAQHLQQRFWEMYCWCTLDDLGISGTSGPSGPDIRFAGSPTTWVECVAAKAGQGADAVPDHSGVDGTIDVDSEKIILRYANAIDTKARYWTERWLPGGVVSSNDAFVIAVNGGGVPWAWTDDPTRQLMLSRIIQTVLPLGHLQIHIDPESGTTLRSDFQFRDCILKTNGSPVATNIFLQDHRHVSAVLFSLVTPDHYPERRGDDFLLIHNPKAHVPLARGWLVTGFEYWVEGTKLRKRQHGQG